MLHTTSKKPTKSNSKLSKPHHLQHQSISTKSSIRLKSKPSHKLHKNGFQLTTFKSLIPTSIGSQQLNFSTQAPHLTTINTKINSHLPSIKSFPSISTTSRQLSTRQHKHHQQQLFKSKSKFNINTNRFLPFSTTSETSHLQMSSDLSTNPLYKKSVLPFETPDFTQIKIEHFKPAILEGMKEELDIVAKIVANPDPPTFENTILPFELGSDLSHRARNVFSNLSISDSTDALMELDEELSPIMSNHSDDIYLNEDFFKRIDIVYNNLQTKPEDFAHLSSESRRLIEVTHRNFILAGAKLDNDGRKLMRQYNETLSSLENKFSQNLIKITKHSGIIITDVNELDGLTKEQIDAAAELAKERQLPEGQYVLQLVNTTRNPLLQSLKNRNVRQRLYELSTSRGFDGEYDQSDIVYQILTTRAKIAELLSFPNFSAYQLTEQMAKTPDAAISMLKSMVPNVLNNMKRELSSLEKYFKIDHPQEDASLEAWDWEYYAERTREKEYDVDPNVLREYFLFENVLEHGVFFTLKKLFGIEFKKRTDIPTQHPDITVYEVIDHDGTIIGLFHADYFVRPPNGETTKSGGAWMSSWVDQNYDRQQKPVIINNMNIIKNINGPTFLSLDEVSTMLHELGHGCHGLFSRGQHQSLSGTNVSTDFVEFPSTTLEDYSIHPDVISNYAKHYKTGESIPQEQLERVIQASKFNLGYETLEYVNAALIDLEWHTLTLNELESHFSKFTTKADAIKAFEKATYEKYGITTTLVPPRYHTQYFSHSMTSYSSRYYAYIWSEIFAADAFDYITRSSPNPGLSRENGDKIRYECYQTGNTRDTMESYIKFRGSKPTTDALLVRRGLSVEAKQ